MQAWQFSKSKNIYSEKCSDVCKLHPVLEKHRILYIKKCNNDVIIVMYKKKEKVNKLYQNVHNCRNG